MSICPGCESLPGPLPAAGSLCLWPPLGHTLSKLRKGLTARQLAVESPTPECLSVAVSERLFPLLHALAESTLSSIEQDECKVLLLPTGTQPTLGDLGRVNSLTHLLAQYKGRWLVELLANRQLLTLFQPIVYTDDPQHVLGYECLVRGIGSDGQLIKPETLYQAARHAGLLYHLDRAARLHHIAAAQRHDLLTKVFINFNPASIYDPAFCLQSTLAAIQQTDIPPENFVFEVVESDYVTDAARLPQILDFYRRAGYRVALDDLGAGYSSLNLLSMLRPDYIKLDMQLMRGIDADPYKGEIVAKLIELAHNLKVQVIAEGIETVGEWNWAETHGADFTQGYLFGRPQPEPQQICTPQAVQV